MPDRLTPAQIRGARAMLGWAMLDLARAAGISISTVKRVEGPEPQPASAEAHALVRGALERAGAAFLDDDGGIGVRVRARAPGQAASVRRGPGPWDADARAC